jgi:hypothetical protein
MRPQLEEVQLLENYLHHRLPHEQRQEVEIRLLWDREWQQNLFSQQQAYQVIRQEGRRQLRQELEAIHSRLFCT